MKNLKQILATARSITVSPIAHPQSQSTGRLHHEIEMRNEEEGYGVIWDDTQQNDSRPGDLFAFVIGASRKHSEVEDGECEVRRILSILPASYRPEVWDNSPEGHHTRQVLVLGDALYRGTWVELANACGKKGYGKTYPNGDIQLQPLQKNTRYKL